MLRSLVKTFLVALLSFHVGLEAFADTIRFHNTSQHPVWVAECYSKDTSIAGIGGNGFTDPNPFTHTRGYREIKAGGSIEIENSELVKVGNQSFRGGLAAIRVVVGRGNDLRIVHPTAKSRPAYYPTVHGMRFGWSWTLKASSQSYIDKVVRDLNNAGNKDITQGMYYHLSQWKNDSNGSFWYGVGAAGTESARIINEWWNANATFQGYVFNVANRTGEQREFRLSFHDSVTNDWKTFSDWRSATSGATFSWSHDESVRISKDPAGKDLLRLESRSFGGQIATWGPPLNTTHSQLMRNGERREVINFTVGNQ